MNLNRRHWLWLIPLLLLTTWLGARSLNTNMFWWDEYITFNIVGGAHYGPISVSEMFSRMMTKSIGDLPGYYLLLYGWGRLVGWTPFAVRSLSLMAGILTVAWTYRLGRDMKNIQVGLAAALTIGASAILITFMHELRTYAVATLLATIFIWGYWRVSQGKTHIVTQIAFVLSIPGLLYTHYLIALIIVPVILYHLLFMPKTVQWLRIPILMMIGGAFFLPWISIALKAVAFGNSLNALPMTTGEILYSLVFAFSNGTLLLLIIPVLSVRLLRSNRGVQVLWFVTLTLLVLLLALDLHSSIIKNVRYLFAFWPLLAALSGFGFVQLLKTNYGRYLAYSIAAFWLFAGIWNSFTPQYNDYLFRDVLLGFFRPHLPLNVMADVISKREHRSTDAVIFDSPIQSWAIAGSFDIYFHPLALPYTLTDWLSPDPKVYETQLGQFIGNAQRVWFGVEQNMLPNFRQAALNQLFSKDFVHCENTLNYPDLRLDLYARDSMCCAEPDTPSVIKYDDVAQLAAIKTKVSGNALSVFMSWIIDPKSLPDTYSIGLHIDNSPGKFVQQADQPLPADAYSCQQTQVQLNSLPPGHYRLMLVIYKWETGDRLNGQVITTGENGNRLQIGEFDIETAN